jgi:hypothetical protein
MVLKLVFSQAQKPDLTDIDASFNIFVCCNFSSSGLWFYLPSAIHVSVGGVACDFSDVNE